MNLALLLIAGLLNLVVGITALVLLFSPPKVTRREVYIALAFVGVFLLSEISTLVLIPDLVLENFSPGMLVLIDSVAALSWFATVVLSLKLCRLHQIDLFRTRILSHGQPPPIGPDSFIAATVVLVTCLAFTTGLFWWLRPVALIAEDETPGATLLDPNSWRPFIAYFVSLFQLAANEELTYRLCVPLVLFHFIRPQKNRFLIASLLPLVLWLLAHQGSLENPWIKYLQILPLGLGLTYLTRRHGIEIAILTHFVFNLLVDVCCASFVQFPSS